MMMRALIVCLVACVTVFGGNLLKEDAWEISDPQYVEKLADGSWQLTCPDEKSSVKLSQTIQLNQKEIIPIEFGGVFLNIENSYPRRESTYGIYMDLTLADGKAVNCVVIGPDPNRTTWELMKRTYKATAPVVKAKFVIVLSRRKSKAVFKNIYMQENVPLKSDRVRNHGVCVDDSEVRNCIASLDAQGRPFVLMSPLDAFKKNYLLYTELDTGKTFQYSIPVNGGFISGAALTPEGKFVFGLSSEVVIFDVNAREMKLGDAKAPGNNWVTAIGNDGRVWLGNVPCTLFAVNPATGHVEPGVRVDPVETQLYWIASDDEDWLYCGVGMGRAGVVAYHPATGQMVALLDEKDRVQGCGYCARQRDGRVYINSPSGFSAMCRGGKIVEKPAGPRNDMPLPHLKYGTMSLKVDAKRKVVRYDIHNREILWEDGSGKLKSYPITYKSGGASMTSVGVGPDGNIYASSAHPHHFVRYEPTTGKMTDFGYNPIIGGGNFCNMTPYNGKLYLCEYAHGRLWEFNPNEPYQCQASKFFGQRQEELAEKAELKDAKISHLDNIMLCQAETDDSSFRFFAVTDKKGPQYLNLRFYKFPTYGIVTMKVGGQTQTFDLCGEADHTKIYTFGPFTPEGGKLPVDFTVVKSPKGKYRWFSLTGFELADAPRGKEKETNPHILGRWPKEIMRPRTVQVNDRTKEVVFAGFSYDGMDGGCIGVHNLLTGENSTITDWLPGESCIAMFFEDDAHLVGGTTISTHGGHVTVTDASVFRMDWNTRKVVNVLRLPGTPAVIAVAPWRGRILAATSNGNLHVINPESFAIEKTYSIGVPVRNALLKADGDRMFLLQVTQISELDPTTFEPVPQSAMPQGEVMTGGGAYHNGSLFFLLSTTSLGEYVIP